MSARTGAGATGGAWRLPMGASVVEGGVRFRVWAPTRQRVEVEIQTPSGARFIPLDRDTDGCFSGLVPGIGAGARYRYRLDGGACFPDPYSRYQPEGVHGPSEVVDPAAFAWTDHGWPGLDRERLVIYEMHIGTFTPEGTFDSVIPHLPYLKRLGVTAIEIMPVAECPGRWNWGYDGVYLYAPASYYGGAAALKRLVDAAHCEGLGIIMDVVYNHLGPEGNYLGQFCPDYFTSRYQTPWGEALNFDGPGSRWVRAFMLDNAAYWLCEYHCDGLRLDAVHAIYDESEKHLLQELGEHARAAAERPVVLILESHDNDVRLIRPPEEGGFGYDATWADDFHHAVRTYLTGERDGYFGDYPPTLDTIARAIEAGFFYQGEHAPYWGGPRGTRVTNERGSAFVFCIQNHDQVGNRAQGERLHHEIDLDRFLAATALLLLSPETPLLFQGQEYAASTPFLYFTDHPPELGRLVTEGRRAEFSCFDAFRDPARRELIPDPQAESTFYRSKLRLEEREQTPHRDVLRLHEDLLRLVHDDPVLCRRDRLETRAWTLGPDTLVMRRQRGRAQRLIFVHFGDPQANLLSDERFYDLRELEGWRTLWTCRTTAGIPAALLESPAGPVLVFGGPSALVLARD